ncbi:protein FAR1-RELATED SEQUENCE 6-like [Corylus avellana]|uniref:protein FAR1-RELATED SEQUENCE 6-like n=1 Tax=Corylus avellana TaxID=13451 RepID=UPI00286C7D55|nr:protein FAR1-RELATED SEQUENCE 6-like [Corylus avellana]XP_059439637.1 protein FAR1-RELATED SEQUENCE 6-like [Corylus avellana]XP_059439638.1 protein FAR1-RELATED SEQUENCE 6-like [Corylus avellana]XP_059439639.1 protein FAR1-RELATED SEQUENCE 6-like [Corylus avellana]XP_059439640.1 protein FAR1-RELATED SEQUENCE 6-like [Corylus avellana]XP_059439641.1 protein FAR1-RELATED SEQUENCE 6-like [Corylus avellana]XP_059439642.1 protein FAR1-RELATED SEQUENCE 6-like [Corylus avellana]XP_059439643.1 pro
MGIVEESKPPNPSKPSSSAQEIPTTHYFDWSSSLQAPFFASTVASTTPNPYLSRSQHLLIPPYGMPVPPYGMPVPYPGLLPPWGVYTHPNMTTTPNPLHVNIELEGKGPYGNDRVCTKKSMGTPGSACNDSASHCLSSPLANSVDSDNEGTLDAIEKNNEKQDSYGSKKRRFHHMVADGANTQSHTVGAIGEALVPPASLPLVMGSKSVMPEQLMQIPNDDEPFLEVAPQIDENEVVCDLELVDKDDNDVQSNKKEAEPEVGMKFSSEKELILYYRRYAQQSGFGVTSKGGKNNPDGSHKYVTLTCARYGKKQTDAINIHKPNPTTKTGCKAKINASFRDGAWCLTTVNVNHNHSLSPSKTRFFRCYRRMDDNVKRRLELNDIAGIGVSKNFNSLVVEGGGYENLSFMERDCRNFINKARHLRLGKGGAGVLYDYFTRMREMNDGFYAVMDLDDDSRLRNVFWADARSRAAYKYFGDVVTFDTTYLTNIYKMPFAPFVGVNHHGQSILFGAGLLSSEDTTTFVWLFETWLKCMNGQAPVAIITDQDKAMKSAIAKVFPRARHRFCLWHIMKKFPEKLGSHAQYKCGLKSAIQSAIYDSQTCVEFDNSWQGVLEKYNLRDNAWLCWLYSERAHWIPAYLKDTFWAGMQTTQRSESMNAFFDNYVNSRSTLKEFVDQFDNALRRKVENEKVADFNSFNATIPCVSHFSIEKEFQELYTNAKFKEVRQEFSCLMYCNCSLIKSEGAISTYEVSDEVTVDDYTKERNFCVYFNGDECEVKCTCGLFECRGILCRHALAVLTLKKVKSLPTKYFLDRWRKDLKRAYTLIESSYNVFSCNPDAQRYDCLLKKCSELATLTSTSEDHYMDAMHCIDMLLAKYKCSKYEPSPPSHDIPCASSKSNEGIDGVVVKSTKVLSPIAVKCKGKPRFKRMVSTVEKVVTKTKKKHQSHNNANQKGRKNQACQEIQERELNTNEAPLASITDTQYDRIIGTQETAFIKDTGFHLFE